MPDRRGRKGRSEDMLPKDRVRWAREVWAARDEVVKTTSGIWMLREAAKALGLREEAVDDVLKGNRGGWLALGCFTSVVLRIASSLPPAQI